LRVEKKFLDELEGRRVVERARGYGPNYVASFIEDWKRDMLQYATVDAKAGSANTKG